MLKHVTIFLVCSVMMIMINVSMSIGSEIKPADTGKFITQTIDIKQGKPGAPVTLTYRVPSRISANSLVNVNLDFSTTTPDGRMEVRMNVDSGLELQPPSVADAATIFSLPAASPMNMDVQVLTTQDGLYYLNVQVKEFSPGNDDRRARAFSVPIQVGSTVKNLKNTGNIIDDGKEKIIEMIAE